MCILTDWGVSVWVCSVTVRGRLFIFIYIYATNNSKYDSYSNGRDKEWQDYFAKYLVDRCLSDQFVWDLNPESGDTGGILRGDWWTPETKKLALYASVQPHPSWLNKVCECVYV